MTKIITPKSVRRIGAHRRVRKLECIGRRFFAAQIFGSFVMQGIGWEPKLASQHMGAAFPSQGTFFAWYEIPVDKRDVGPQVRIASIACLKARSPFLGRVEERSVPGVTYQRAQHPHLGRGHFGNGINARYTPPRKGSSVLLSRLRPLDRLAPTEQGSSPSRRCLPIHSPAQTR